MSVCRQELGEGVQPPNPGNSNPAHDATPDQTSNRITGRSEGAYAT